MIISEYKSYPGLYLLFMSSDVVPNPDADFGADVIFKWINTDRNGKLLYAFEGPTGDAKGIIMASPKSTKVNDIEILRKWDNIGSSLFDRFVVY